MPAKVMFMKQKWFPRPHQDDRSWLMSLEGATSTIYPIVMHDEGLGSPSDYEANPEHALFVSPSEPNCYPESRINVLLANLKFSLTKGAIETDKVVAVRVAFMPIFLSFKEDYLAIDELSTFEIQDVLKLQTESADRQGYPLWSGTKLTEAFAGAATLPANVPGLTTNQILESVAFNQTNFYNMMHYMTNSGKLKNCVGGLKWLTLTKDRPFANIQLQLRKKTKFMNPYSFFGVLVHIPNVDTQFQYPIGTDTTAIMHVRCDMSYRYNEWNQNFNFKKA